jgi:L-arabinose isomerase
MGDFAVDTTHLVATLGGQWVNLPLEEYIQRAAAARPAAVRALTAEYRKTYNVAPDVSAEDLEATARVELALRGMIAKYKLSALTYQFMAFGADERTPTVPFVAASRLMAEGLGFGGEGDLLAAMGTSLFNWLKPPASFTEVFTIDFKGNSLFMSHMGEANVALARTGQKIALVARNTPITRTLKRQLVLVTSFQPGPATLCALTPGPGGRWRIISSRMAIADFGPLKRLDVPHFKLVPNGDVRDFLTAYANAGGPHHSAVCFGDARPRLKLAAKMLAADYCEI